MITHILIVAILIILTKFLDCWTTAHSINGLYQEQNPLARWLMQKFGIAFTIWGFFVLSLVITALSLALVLGPLDQLFYQSFFVVVGIGISIVQGAVAHCNYCGKDNFTTKIIRKLFARLRYSLDFLTTK